MNNKFKMSKKQQKLDGIPLVAMKGKTAKIIMGHFGTLKKTQSSRSPND
jgi:hypothetical protein